MTVEVRDAINFLIRHAGVTPSSITALRASAADPAQPLAQWVKLLGPLTQAQLGRLLGMSAPVISRCVKAETDSGRLVVHRLRTGHGGRPINVVALPNSPLPMQAAIAGAERMVAAVLLVLAADPATLEAIVNVALSPHRFDTDVPSVNRYAVSPAQAAGQFHDSQYRGPAQAPAATPKALE